MFSERRRRRPGMGSAGIIGGSLSLNSFQYFLDFTVPSARGGFQTYGNNTDDGRLFRDPTNTSAGFVPSVSGVYVAVASAGIKRSDMGAWNYPSATNRNLWARDMTNAVWVATSATVAKDQTGIDNAANAASSILATAGNATVFQTVTIASAVFLYYAFVKRLVGSGTISMTVDGGTTYTDITTTIGTGTQYNGYTLISIPVQTLANPVIGFKITTSGDKIAVDFNQLQTPPNAGVNIPNRQVVATTSATILNSQSRPSANNADAAPKSLITTAQGAFAFYWQGRSERTSGSFPITGSTGIFCSVQSDGSVNFTAGGATANAGVGLWRVGLGQVNKILGCFDASGNIRVSLNGSGGVNTGATTTPALDHFDMNTNGAGQNSGYGVTEQFGMSPNLMFPLTRMNQLTT